MLARPGEQVPQYRVQRRRTVGSPAESCPHHDDGQRPEPMLSQHANDHRQAGKATKIDDSDGSAALPNCEMRDPIETLMREFHEPAVVDLVVDNLSR